MTKEILFRKVTEREATPQRLLVLDSVLVPAAFQHISKHNKNVFYEIQSFIRQPNDIHLNCDLIVAVIVPLFRRQFRAAKLAVLHVIIIVR